LTKRLLALLVIAAVLVGACTRTTNSANAPGSKPFDLYAAGPTTSDVRQLLGDDRWAEAYPTFGVRPLNALTLPLQERFDITRRFVRSGTAEHFLLDYVLWESSSSATTEMTNTQNALGTPISGPKAGDQVFYYGGQERAAPGLFVFRIYIRVGPVIVRAEWTRAEARPGLTLLGQIANKLASKVKDVLGGKVRPSPPPSADTSLLPPINNGVTFLGAARLPVEVVPSFFSSATPDSMISTFTNVGVTDFVYGDYVLNNDVAMEVRAAEFTFSSQTEATNWIYSIVGQGGLDASGIYSTYSDALGTYIFIFTSGVHGAMLFCSAAVPGEAASRACETPLVTVISSWRRSLSKA
jgi:hypothetical protein